MAKHSTQKNQHPSRWAFGQAVAGAALALSASNASALHTIEFGEDRSLTGGLWLRSSFSSLENGSANGKSASTDFNLDHVWLVFGASLNKHIKGAFNLARHSEDTVRILDAIAKFELTPEFNIWAGRMLTPSDRSNLDGPFFLGAYSYPGIVAQYPSKFAGRDNGVTLWGKLFDKHLVYSAGVFEGHNNYSGASSEADNVLFAGRLQYDFWNADLTPAYYTSSTFYGKDLLSVAVAGQYQHDGVGSAELKGDYGAVNIDALLEKNLGFGVLDLEGALYWFNTDGVSDVVGSLLPTTPGATDNVGGISQGNAYLANVSFLFPQTVGWGKFQPYFRYQGFDRDSTLSGGASAPAVAAGSTRQFDYGVHYVIDGHNARISATYTNLEQSGRQDQNSFVLGVQLQF